MCWSRTFRLTGSSADCDFGKAVGTMQTGEGIEANWEGRYFERCAMMFCR